MVLNRWVAMTTSRNAHDEQQNLSPRTAVQLPVSINGEPGYTRDISVSGMFIVQSRQQAVGSRLNFSLDLDTPMGVMKLRCEGEVVRVEQDAGGGGEIGLGIRIIQLSDRQLLNEHAINATATAL